MGSSPSLWHWDASPRCVSPKSILNSHIHQSATAVANGQNCTGLDGPRLQRANESKVSSRPGQSFELQRGFSLLVETSPKQKRETTAGAWDDTKSHGIWPWNVAQWSLKNNNNGHVHVAASELTPLKKKRLSFQLIFLTKYKGWAGRVEVCSFFFF